MKFLLDNDVPDDLSFLLQQLGHEVSLLRQVVRHDATDPTVLQFAHEHGWLVVTCNRDDFVRLGQQHPHHGIVVVIRRKTRAAERAALFRLLERAGEAGPTGSINFA